MRVQESILIIILRQPGIYTRVVPSKPGNYGMSFLIIEWKDGIVKFELWEGKRIGFGLHWFLSNFGSLTGLGKRILDKSVGPAVLNQNQWWGLETKASMFLYFDSSFCISVPGTLRTQLRHS